MRACRLSNGEKACHITQLLVGNPRGSVMWLHTAPLVSSALSQQVLEPTGRWSILSAWSILRVELKGQLVRGPRRRHVAFNVFDMLVRGTDRVRCRNATGGALCSSRTTTQLTTQFRPRTKWSHLLLAKMVQIEPCLYARPVFHILLFSISTV